MGADHPAGSPCQDVQVSDESARERLDDCTRRWSVGVARIHQTDTSLIAFGTHRSMPVVLKVVRFRGEEWNAGRLLVALRGRGAVPVLQHEPGALLMPQLTPGHDLAGLTVAGRDGEATHVIAGLIERLTAADAPTLDALPRAVDWLPGFQRYRDRAVGIFAAEVVDRAESTFRDLCAPQRAVHVLHADLHHYNVLFDDALGWTVIDPQGIAAEREFDLGASLRNPIDAPRVVGDPFVLQRRLEVFRQRLGIDPDRALRWAFAQAVLAVLWPGGTDLSAPFAAMVRAALQVLGEPADARQ